MGEYNFETGEGNTKQAFENVTVWHDSEFQHYFLEFQISKIYARANLAVSTFCFCPLYLPFPHPNDRCWCSGFCLEHRSSQDLPFISLYL